MPYAIRLDKIGGPENLKWVEVSLASPGPGEVLVRNVAIGLNYIDTYYRSGLYPTSLPVILGMEGAGRVEKIGPGVQDLKPGDRVAYASPIGAYCEVLLRPADRLVKIPDAIDDKTAAAIMLKGMTAWYLLRRTFPVKSGQRILVHAAAGGVGLILCQWAAQIGVEVIGVVGSEEKANLARKAGCAHVIISARENFVERIKEITKGEGVPVVYDGVGKETFMGSLDSLSVRGLMVSFGNASGPVSPFDIGVLGQKGSLFLTRASLAHYTSRREDLLAAASDLFSVVAGGGVKIFINQTYPLREAARAHQDLESRKTTGSTVLLP